MKTQRILGILWLALFSFILVLWLWQAIEKAESSGLYRVFISPAFLFGAIASFFLFLGARWARISVGIIALLIVALVILENDNHWARWPDACLGIFALASAITLLFPRRKAVA